MYTHKTLIYLYILIYIYIYVHMYIYKHKLTQGCNLGDFPEVPCDIQEFCTYIHLH